MIEIRSLCYGKLASSEPVQSVRLRQTHEIRSGGKTAALLLQAVATVVSFFETSRRPRFAAAAGSPVEFVGNATDLPKPYR